MAEFRIGDHKQEDLDRLRRRAEADRLSLEGELRNMLVAASRQLSVTEARKIADRLRSRLVGRPHSDSTELIRESRDG